MKMIIFSRRGFTIMEMMVIILIIGILATAVYSAFGPYMMRSRDTKRITDILSYTSILDTYDKNFDTFPSNFGSGGNAVILGYCLSELPTRPDVLVLGSEGKFTAISGGSTSAPPLDPTNQVAIASLCDRPGSYVYSRIKYGTNLENQIAIIAARLEMRVSGNYGTGADLIDTSKVQNIIDARRSTIPDNAPDQLYIVYKLH